MANRFLDTNYYKSPFVRGLKGSLKSLYSFIICDCDGAGIWNLDLDAASLYTGFSISMLEFEEWFINKNKAISVGGDKYFFPDFIEHQYPSGLQYKNTAHKNFIKTLKKYDLVDEELNVKKKGSLKGLESLISLGNGNGLGNGKDRVVGKGFNKMTIPDDVNELPDQKVNSVIEQMRITQQTDINKKQVVGMWEVFKIQKLTGKQFFENEERVHDYFLNWIKTQKFNNGSGSGHQKNKLGNKSGGFSILTDAINEGK